MLHQANIISPGNITALTFYAGYSIIVNLGKRPFFIHSLISAMVGTLSEAPFFQCKVHEFVHILTRTPGICDTFGIERQSRFEIEIKCNRIAAEALVPQHTLLVEREWNQIAQSGWDDTCIQKIARNFAVSREVIIGRLFTLNKISLDFYKAKLSSKNKYLRRRNMLNIEDIIEVRKANGRAGYEIVFPEGKTIWIVKRRTIIGLLLLIKYEYCSEADLVGANDRLQVIKGIIILAEQNGRCNICGAILNSKVLPHTFAKDRVRLEFDHRKPVDRGGDNSQVNCQALYHYCNKCKRQMCFVCKLENCSQECALVRPETQDIVQATTEDISDRITNRNIH